MDDHDEFSGFLRQVAESGELEGPARGIVRLAVDSGVDRLTQRQHVALMLGLKDWIGNLYPDYPAYVEISEGRIVPEPVCVECSNPTPWCEVYIAGGVNGGVCSWCMQVHHKDD